MKKLKMKLRVEDLQVSSLVAEGDGGGVQSAEAYTYVYATCRIGGCPSAPGGPLCVTEEYGGGDTCETGPVYYC